MESCSKKLKLVSLFLFVSFAAFGVRAQNTIPDSTKQPTLYVVPYAHLDTQWRWDYVQTIDEYIPATMHDNFTLFEKYPHYIFNFSGANRYRMMKEYYPDDYATVKQYVAAGRWFPSGSAMEESDVNTPSAESLIRQILNISSAANSAGRARNICCLTVSAFPHRFQASWRIWA